MGVVQPPLSDSGSRGSGLSASLVPYRSLSAPSGFSELELGLFSLPLPLSLPSYLVTSSFF